MADKSAEQLFIEQMHAAKVKRQAEAAIEAAQRAEDARKAESLQDDEFATDATDAIETFETTDIEVTQTGKYFILP